MATPTTQSYLDLLFKDLTRHEGYRATIYLDGDGYPTIGVGVLIRGKDALHAGNVSTLRAYVPVDNLDLYDKVMSTLKETLQKSSNHFTMR